MIRIDIAMIYNWLDQIIKLSYSQNIYSSKYFIVAEYQGKVKKWAYFVLVVISFNIVTFVIAGEN